MYLSKESDEEGAVKSDHEPRFSKIEKCSPSPDEFKTEEEKQAELVSFFKSAFSGFFFFIIDFAIRDWYNANFYKKQLGVVSFDTQESLK